MWCLHVFRSHYTSFSIYDITNLIINIICSNFEQYVCKNRVGVVKKKHGTHVVCKPEVPCGVY